MIITRFTAEALANTVMAITLQYQCVKSIYTHLKFTQCYMSIKSQKELRAVTSRTGRTRHFNTGDSVLEMLHGCSQEVLPFSPVNQVPTPMALPGTTSPAFWPQYYLTSRFCSSSRRLNGARTLESLIRSPCNSSLSTSFLPFPSPSDANLPH